MCAELWQQLRLVPRVHFELIPMIVFVGGPRTPNVLVALLDGVVLAVTGSVCPFVFVVTVCWQWPLVFLMILRAFKRLIAYWFVDVAFLVFA